MKNFKFCLVAVVMLAVTSGCVSKSVFLKENQRANQLQSKSDTLAAQIQSLQDQLKGVQADLETQKGSNAELMKTLEAKKGELNERLAALTRQYQDLLQKNQDLTRQLQETQAAKEAEIAKLKASQDELVNGLKSEVEAGQLTITQLKGRLSVNMVDKILFNSGEAEVKPEGRNVLIRVGEVLKKLKDTIRIEGYTDNVPISGSLRAKYPTNWELSTARATAVVRYLQDYAEIPADRLIAAGFGETHPIADNATPAGRQQNRRIEIVLVPYEIARSTAPLSPPAKP